MNEEPKKDGSIIVALISLGAIIYAAYILMTI